MPEPPDFEQLARHIDQLRSELEDAPDRDASAELVSAVAAQLRQVWNARGAADIEALDAETWTRRDAETLRKLDR